tara:strand:+ start:884 stop:1381 length:498 start_codon:yes stop_codon:yes gene_type:complete
VSLNLDEKKAVVDEVSAKVGLAQTVVLAEYRGIEVSELTKLRANARSQGVYLRVIKNTLFKRAVKGTVFSDLVSEMNGPLIYAISEDAISAAKVLNEFSKKNEKLKIKAGNYAGSLLTNIDVSDLANIPSKEILISQLLGLMQSPISSLARVISLIASKKESESN